MKKILSLFCFLLLSLQLTLVLAASPEDAQGGPGDRMRTLEERIHHLEEAIKSNPGGTGWYDRIELSGLVEVETSYVKTDFKDGATSDKDESDIDLSNVEIGIDSDIAKYVSGHVLFKYEDNDIFLDEGLVVIDGSDSMPVYLIAGRQYIPFGFYDSHFVTDPNTTILGETNEGALVAGCRLGDDLFDLSLGTFNGDAKESGDDKIDSYVASIVVTPCENIAFGASYTSNLATSDSFVDKVIDPDNLQSLVDGWSAFISLGFLDRFKIIGEYVSAIDRFKAGEIYDAADVKERKPSAWNVEFGVIIIDNLELAIRYDGSYDGGSDFLPESQYGAVLNWGLFENTKLALEYMRSEFEDDFQKTDSFTAQLAVEF